MHRGRPELATFDFDLALPLPILRAVADLPAASITARTRCCAVLGHPVRHSASPAMQNAGIARLDLPWRYLAFDVEPANLAAAIEGARAMRFIGLNLTVPHKVAALTLLDHLDDTAKNWGAVNTVRFEARDSGGAWQPLARFQEEIPGPVRAVGFNTDAEAIIESLREDLGFDPAGARIVLLGAGGAGRVAGLRLAAERPRTLHVVNRTASTAAALAAEILARHPKLDVQTGYPASGPIDLIVNATSLGLNANDPSPLDDSRLPISEARLVFDMIYRPAVTPLLERARAAGCRTANGLGMLLHQGARALELWSGCNAPITEMRQALTHAVYG
jgi:shikimate dehydrogenase